MASSVRIDIFLVNFNYHQRYYIRVKNRCFIQRLIAAFHILENIIICDKWCIIFMPAWSRRSFSNACLLVLFFSDISNYNLIISFKKVTIAYYRGLLLHYRKVTMKKSNQQAGEIRRANQIPGEYNVQLLKLRTILSVNFDELTTNSEV